MEGLGFRIAGLGLRKKSVGFRVKGIRLSSFEQRSMV